MLIAITDRRMMQPADAARAGADLVQVREKDLDGGALLAFVRAVMATGVRVIVNDRVDVALATGAYGVHLPERGLAIADARALGATFVGVSRHTLDGVREAADAMPIYPSVRLRTPGKRTARPLVLEGARAILDAKARARKLVAVGGIEALPRACCRTARVPKESRRSARWSARSGWKSRGVIGCSRDSTVRMLVEGGAALRRRYRDKTPADSVSRGAGDRRASCATVLRRHRMSTGRRALRDQDREEARSS